ncbi:bifunctional MaoC family dehydratase N-terminal/OB-fold nucleic acid binding domain-containing protein [Nocardioides piscis]|uniref:bifunctional MaoC family dehydratase N-terminal/OB-fold nucleic acid binding domain-containing protein n=1 Tax=Nocardioides piscis TaxID=2714938 RepID=UPI001FEB209E|nr:zinc ribbon domain-containing protein [Nocardioides piscis]
MRGPSEVTTTAEVGSHDWIMARADEFIARGDTEPRPALDEVNVAMIRHWAEAMGDTDPRWQGPDAVAPPAMAQVWTMYGLDPHRPADDPLHGTMQLLDEAGFTSVLGTNCDQTYARCLKPGERPAITTRLESVVGPKQTGVGEGYFVTTLNTWWVTTADGESEAVATMTFRVLKFKPGTGRPSVDKTRTVRPVVNRDNEFFFAGTRAGELRIQKCNACGALRHPPGPVCPDCHAMDRGHVLASGRGTIFSFLVHHAPQVPGKQLPLPLALVELPEGVRMVGRSRLHRDTSWPSVTRSRWSSTRSTTT